MSNDDNNKIRTMCRLEMEVEKMIDDYGAPEAETTAIRDFLMGSMNLNAIAEMSQEMNKDEFI